MGVCVRSALARERRAAVWDCRAHVHVHGVWVGKDKATWMYGAVHQLGNYKYTTAWTVERPYKRMRIGDYACSFDTTDSEWKMSMNHD